MKAAPVERALPRCPLDEGPVTQGSYYVSPSLSGADPGSIADPGHTPLLYEGYVRPDSQQVIAFTRHRSAKGRKGCIVGYADGHVGFVPSPTAPPAMPTGAPLAA